MAAARCWASCGATRAARARGDGPQLMLGCYERALFPRVSRAARKLAPALRVDRRQGCCGALHAHNGELERGRELAEQLGRRLDGTIVTTAGGCAAHLSTVLGRARVRELSEYLAAEQDGRSAARVRSGAGSRCRTPATCATGWASSASRAR